MSNVEKLSISVTTAQAEAIREAVREGAYASSSDAVRDALRLWDEKRKQRAASVRRLAELWEEGLASGPPQPRRSVEEIVAAGMKRLAKHRGS